MTRKKLFLHGLSFSFLGIFANIIYSLGSIPLALHYLGKEQFGLWSVVVSLVTYLYLLDLGISASTSRLLVDAKDRRKFGDYGSTILTSAITQSIIGIVVVIAGFILGWLGATLFDIPVNLASDFRLLIILQSIVAGISIASRVCAAPFYAYQRQDLAGISTIGLFIVYFIAMWIGFHMGLGLYAMVLSMAAGQVWALLFNVYFGFKLGLFPKGAEWGRPTWSQFHSIFSFSREIFLMSVGWQLLSSTPLLVITRTLGLDAAAAWSIALKPFMIVAQFLYRPSDLAIPAFSEMFVRSEIPLLKRRFLNIFHLTSSLSAVGFGAMAILCGPFVQLWTNGRVEWPWWNYTGIAAMLLIYNIFRPIIGIVGITKQIRATKYVYFIESLVFVGLSLLLTPRFGVLAIPVIAILGHLMLSAPLGIRYTSTALNMQPNEFFRWLARPIFSVCSISALALLIGYAIHSLSSWHQLIVGGILFSVGALPIMFFSIDPSLRSEIIQIVRSRLQRLMPKSV